jgi:hypothetical protein
MNSKQFFKLSLFFVVLFSAIGAYLFFNLLSKSVNSNLVINPVAAADPWAIPAKSCRYLTGGRTCAVSEFHGCNPAPGKVCVCTGNDTHSPDDTKWTYADTQQYDIKDVPCGPVTGTNEQPVQWCASHPGQSFTMSQCNNPGQCAGTASTPTPSPSSTPTPTPSPVQQNLNVRTVCRNNQNQDVAYNGKFNLYVDIPDATHRAFPNTSIGSTVSMSLTTRDNGNTTPILPNPVNLSAQNLPSGVSVFSNSCAGGRNVNSGETCLLVFHGCATSGPQSQSISVAARCIDGTRENLNIPFTSTRGNGDGITPETVSYEGTGGGTITIGNIPQNYRTTYPNIKLVGSATKTVNAGGTATYDYTGCTRSTTATPSVTLQKTLVSTDSQQYDSANPPPVVFNIVVTNTGNVDITSFPLYDEYDSRYIRFERAEVNNTVIQDYTHTNADSNGIRRISWADLPPTTFNGGTLPVGQSFTITMRFRAILPTTNIPANDDDNQPDYNDNCAVVNTISSGSNTVTTVNRRSCAEYNVLETPASLQLQVTKSPANQTVVRGEAVRFQGTLRNTTTDRTYNSINFVDNFDGRYLRFSSLRVSKYNSNNQLVRAYDINNPVVAVNGASSSVSRNMVSETVGDVLVPLTLAPSEYAIFDIVFISTGSVSNTCDTVVGTVTSGNDTASRNAQACTTITTPNPPNTGASFLLNFIIPSITATVAFAAKKFVLVG